MWKIALGFAVFAAVVLYVMMQSGADIDMGGEKHGIDATAPAAAPADAASTAPQGSGGY